MIGHNSFFVLFFENRIVLVHLCVEILPGVEKGRSQLIIGYSEAVFSPRAHLLAHAFGKSCFEKVASNLRKVRSLLDLIS